MLSPLPFQWEVDRAPPPSASTQHQHNAFPEGLVLMEALREKQQTEGEHYTSDETASLLTPSWACPTAAVDLGSQPSIVSFPSSSLSSEFQGRNPDIFCYFMMQDTSRSLWSHLIPLTLPSATTKATLMWVSTLGSTPNNTQSSEALKWQFFLHMFQITHLVRDPTPISSTCEWKGREKLPSPHPNPCELLGPEFLGFYLPNTHISLETLTTTF